MKKLLFAAALAASLTVLADVTSANCVGYISRDIAPDTFYMIGVQFENVGGDATADLNKVLGLKNIAACGFDDRLTDGAEIQVRVGNVYNYYYYINDAWDADDNPVDGDVWADADGYVITENDLLQLGDGFWFNARGKSAGTGASLTVNGEVSSATELGKDFVGTSDGYFSIKANPFPVATDLNTVKNEGLVAVGYDNRLTTGNEIQVRIGNVYNYYYYINDAWDADDNPVDGDVWANADGYIVTDADLIAPGASFWMHARQNGKLIFSLTK